MSPLAVGIGVLAVVASFFSCTEEWMSKNVKAGNWSNEMAAEWASARNLRPCVGARDAACKYLPQSEGK